MHEKIPYRELRFFLLPGCNLKNTLYNTLESRMQNREFYYFQKSYITDFAVFGVSVNTKKIKGKISTTCRAHRISDEMKMPTCRFFEKLFKVTGSLTKWNPFEASLSLGLSSDRIKVSWNVGKGKSALLLPGCIFLLPRLCQIFFIQNKPTDF